MTTALTITAIILGPIFAVQAQKWLERLREKKQLKEQVFRTLMTTRNMSLSPDHVRALNMIDIAFSGRGKKNKNVRDSWKLYLDQLYNGPRDRQAPDYNTRLNAWTSKNYDVLTDMLFEMARSLNYNFDKVHLKRAVYTPQGYTDTEIDQQYIRTSLVELFLDTKSIPIHIVEPPPTEEAKPSKKSLPR